VLLSAFLTSSYQQLNFDVDSPLNGARQLRNQQHQKQQQQPMMIKHYHHHDLIIVIVTYLRNVSRRLR